MKIAAWNVNSVNSRKVHLVNWLKEEQIDVALLQETKCRDSLFPRDDFENIGYNLAVHGQKTFNGVAVFSKIPIEEQVTELEGNPVPDEARYLETVLSVKGSAIRLISVYVPNGDGDDDTRYKIKLAFMDALIKRLEKLLLMNESVVIGGDFNITAERNDLHDDFVDDSSIYYSEEVRSRFRAITNLGFYDTFRSAHPNEKKFSWWDYRAGNWYQNKGMRLDYLLASADINDKLVKADIHTSMRNKVKPSDHAPVFIQTTD